MNNSNVNHLLAVAVASMLAMEQGKADGKEGGQTLMDSVRKLAIAGCEAGEDAETLAIRFAGTAAKQGIKASTISPYQQAVAGYTLLSAGMVDIGQGRDSSGSIIPVNIMVGGSASKDKPLPKETAIEARKSFYMSDEEKELARVKAALDAMKAGFIKAIKECSTVGELEAWLQAPKAHEGAVTVTVPAEKKVSKAEQARLDLIAAMEAVEEDESDNTGNAELAANG